MSVMHDYRCTECGVTHEHFLSHNTGHVECPECGGEASKVFLTAAKPDWLGLAQGDNASPEAINKFKTMHRQQKVKETRSLSENGDYGPQPGGRGLTYEGPIAADDGTVLSSD